MNDKREFLLLIGSGIVFGIIFNIVESIYGYEDMVRHSLTLICAYLVVLLMRK